MAVNSVDFTNNLGSADTFPQPSPNVWGDCPWNDIQEQVIRGVAFHDDFLDFPLTGVQTTQIAHGRYKVFATAGSSVTIVSAVNSVEKAGGILSLTTDTDNDSASIAHSYPSLLMTGDAATSGKLWFECRVALNTILTNTLGIMIGLAEVEQWTLATGVPFNAGDPITNAASFIGFRKEEDGLGVWDTVYSDRATSFTNIGDADYTAGAANTFLKLGFKYDPTRETDCVRFYANNLQLTNVLSRTALRAMTNLDANALGLIFAMVADSAGTTGASYLDWWRVAQVGLVA